ncbi:biotin--[acetyl-CoA-carboxylase] ligase [Cellulomonas xylanilytica]|uniref:biotin--[biotin carboxyl-carrier protein] ligase n=1 Tax=Cellulomonas xylanilytica TaxID=233583 RepID=A0A510V6X6_9CELL|nr:biotin--[acetyl-CoA-carboxylase] ligase [Cellulomonas xylanilytica]GEK22627.1 biotin--[acetyl-CoA-carboxylase] ligase [Cellulomonas xylanilytica]
MGAVPSLRVAELRDLLLAPAGPLTRVEVVEATGSTSTDLADALRADPTSWPDASVLVAEHQTGGRGRAGRTWETPRGTSLTCSFVVHPPVPATSFGWIGLLTGLGAVNALRATAGVAATLKWPNDLLVPAETEVEGWGAARKVGGILAEVVALPAGQPPAVVIGIGINVLQRADELPVDSATSLALAGAQHVDREGMLVALVAAQVEVAQRWRDSGGDAVASGLADEVAAVCSTLGSRVRVELPGDRVVSGLAARLDDDGALVVVDDDGASHRVLAGDVRHVRSAR